MCKELLFHAIQVMLFVLFHLMMPFVLVFIKRNFIVSSKCFMCFLVVVVLVLNAVRQSVS